MARSGQFAGPNFVFGAPLLSVHPIDNKFPDPQKDEDDEGEVQPIEEQQPPQEGK